MQILVKGWDAAAGYTLAESLVQLIQSLNGEYTHGSENYRIKSIFVRNYPVPIIRDGIVAYSINYIVFYEKY
jgi:hypothetical protein